MTTGAYRVELTGDRAWNRRYEISADAQKLASFLHMGIRGGRKTVSVLFTEKRDATWFRLKWTE